MLEEDLGSPRELKMTVLMTPDMVNFSGKVHGGAILKLLDQVSYACATRYCGLYVVTLSVDQVVFKQPIHVGELVTFLAHVNYTGRSSMEVGIKVIAEDARTKTCTHAVSCFFTMVAVDAQGKPAEVVPVTLHSDVDRRRYERAKLRKEMREEVNQRYGSLLKVKRSS